MVTNQILLAIIVVLCSSLIYNENERYALIQRYEELEQTLLNEDNDFGDPHGGNKNKNKNNNENLNEKNNENESEKEIDNGNYDLLLKGDIGLNGIPFVLLLHSCIFMWVTVSLGKLFKKEFDIAMNNQFHQQAEQVQVDLNQDPNCQEHVKKAINQGLKFTIKEFIFYRMDYLLSNWSSAKLLALLVATYLLIIIGAILYYVVGHKDLTFSESLWNSWTYVADPGVHAEENGTLSSVVALFVTVGGMLLFAILIGIIADGVSDLLDDLKKGKSRIIESGHTLVLGWSDKVLPAIRELAIANESEGGGVVVILAERPKEDMESDLKSTLTPDLLMGTEVICRSGNPLIMADLLKVSAQTSKAVIVLSDPEVDADESDARAVRIVMSLRGIHIRSHVVVEMCDVDNRELVHLVGQGKVETVVAHDVIGRLMIQCARQPGLAQILEEILGFDGDEFYSAQWPSLVGKTFLEASFSFDQAIPVGIKPADPEEAQKQLRNLAFLDFGSIGGATVGVNGMNLLHSVASGKDLKNGSGNENRNRNRNRDRNSYNDNNNSNSTGNENYDGTDAGTQRLPQALFPDYGNGNFRNKQQKGQIKRVEHVKEAQHQKAKPLIDKNAKRAKRPIILTHQDSNEKLNDSIDLTDSEASDDGIGIGIGIGINNIDPPPNPDLVPHLLVPGARSTSVGGSSKTYGTGDNILKRAGSISSVYGTGPRTMLLNPPDKYVIQPGDEILVLAEDDDTYEACQGDAPHDAARRARLGVASQHPMPTEKEPEKLLFCGWRRDLDDMISALDKLVCKGSELHLMCTLPVRQRLKRFRDANKVDLSKLRNLTIHHIVGNAVLRRHLEALELEEYSSILVLADEAFETNMQTADSRSLASLLLIRDIIQRRRAEFMDVFSDTDSDGSNNHLGVQNSSGNVRLDSVNEIAVAPFQPERDIQPPTPPSAASSTSSDEELNELIDSIRRPNSPRKQARRKTFTSSSKSKSCPTENTTEQDSDAKGNLSIATPPERPKTPTRPASTSRLVRRSTAQQRASIRRSWCPRSHKSEHEEKGTTIISEILDSRTKSLISVANISDYVMSNHIIANCLAMVAEDRSINAVLSEILSASGSEIKVSSALDYAEANELLDFWTIMARARKRSEIALGYKPRDEKEVIINPRDKKNLRRWEAGDTVVVLSTY